jgi:hypothetical protein
MNMLVLKCFYRHCCMGLAQLLCRLILRETTLPCRVGAADVRNLVAGICSKAEKEAGEK